MTRRRRPLSSVAGLVLTVTVSAAALAAMAPVDETAGRPQEGAAAGTGPGRPVLQNERESDADGDARGTTGEVGEVGEVGEADAERAEVGGRAAYDADRLLAGSSPLDIARAAHLRGRGVAAASALARARRAGGGSAASWVPRGPDPIVAPSDSDGTPIVTSGRVSALAFRKDGTLLLGAAQGGVWSYDTTLGVSGTWTSRSPADASQSVGALAAAPSDDRIVYEGTGDGTTAPNAYYGDGIWRSADGGLTWAHVSRLFTGESVSDLAVDPQDPATLYAAVTTGIAGRHFVSTTQQAGYGLWKSTDAGSSWSLVLSFPHADRGADAVVVDPRDPDLVVASINGDGIYVSHDAAATWTYSYRGLPDFTLNRGTSPSLGISHPAGADSPTIFTGFDWYTADGAYHPARVFRSTDGGASWTDPGVAADAPGSVEGYCGSQCYYDNEVEPDPSDPQIVYALGQYDYDAPSPSGGIYRSSDGGATWTDLGWNLHPDFHAMAFDPADPAHIAIGNDGGVWQSLDRGGRTGPGAALTATTWQDLNGQIDGTTRRVTHSTGLSIAQYVSIQTVPRVPGELWAGAQDNGTQRASTTDAAWFNQSGGDGGYVEVDQSTPNPVSTAAAAFVFSEYFYISPFRYDPSTVTSATSGEPIGGGIDVADREEFYVPLALNQARTQELFLGTYRVYRTTNAETPRASDVHWTPISGDLTSGCPEGQLAPNGASGCFISALGLSDGGTGVYAGTSEGRVQVSPDATDAVHPRWSRVGSDVLPPRPVARSDWRIAYAAFAGFDEGSPTRPGHVFATIDGGRHWRDATGNLPDVPVNDLVLDPAHRGTLYAATDVGVFTSTDAGRTWAPTASGMPRLAVWALDYDPAHGLLAAGTHGRGAYTVATRSAAPALVVARTAAPASVTSFGTVRYTVRVSNLGGIDATGVRVTAPLPRYATKARIGQGGTYPSGVPTWTGLTVPAGGAITLTLDVTFGRIPSTAHSIVADRLVATSAEGSATSGSPTTTPVRDR